MSDMVNELDIPISAESNEAGLADILINIEAFDVFKATLDVWITDSLKFTLKVPNAIDTGWAATTSEEFSDMESLNYLIHYIPRLLATCLVSINDKPIHEYITGGIDSMNFKILLHPKARAKLTQEISDELNLWVYTYITGKVPFYTYLKSYHDTILPWIEEENYLTGSIKSDTPPKKEPTEKKSINIPTIKPKNTPQPRNKKISKKKIITKKQTTNKV